MHKTLFKPKEIGSLATDVNQSQKTQYIIKYKRLREISYSLHQKQN